jgi:hypothetical protein
MLYWLKSLISLEKVQKHYPPNHSLWQSNQSSALTWMLPSSFRQFMTDRISLVHLGAIEISTIPFFGSIVRIMAIPS